MNGEEKQKYILYLSTLTFVFTVNVYLYLPQVYIYLWLNGASVAKWLELLT